MSVSSRTHPTRRRRPLLSRLTRALLVQGMVATVPAAAGSGGIYFDAQSLQARNIDPRLAELFSEAPRFMAGETSVTLTVNGSARGKVPVRFDADGNLCADASFFKLGGIDTPSSYNERAACFDLKTEWPQAEIHLDPGEERVDVVVPSEALTTGDAGSGSWKHGGTAGIINYDAQYMDSAGAMAGVNFMQLNTEAGVNAGDWIVRSRQSLSRFNGEDSVQHYSAYAQRTFTGIKKVFQAGQIALSNSMFGTGQVKGFQVFPEAALQGSQGGPGLVEGIADSQSVIEVRQSGVLVHTTTVPAGPYRLRGFSLLNTRSDLAVTQTGTDGVKREFIVPASALLLRGNDLTPGLSFGAGRLDQQGAGASPVVGTLASGWSLTPRSTLNAGVLGSSPYHAAAFGLDSQVADGTLLSARTTVARDNRHDVSGASTQVMLNHNLTERLSVSSNISEQTSGFRELSESLQTDETYLSDRSRRQVGLGIGWSAEQAGNFSLSLARSETFSGDMTDYARVSWSRQFGRAYFGLSLEHDTGTRSTRSESRLYATLSLPLGDGQNISSYLNSSRSATRAGSRYSHRGSQDRGWSLSAERDFRSNRASGTGTVDAVTPVSQLSGSLSRNSENYTSWSGRASGAVVVHKDGVTLSPYQVGDTFGVARVGDEAGVRIDTPAGPTWTDGRGYAVLPSLNGFTRSTVQVDTRSLARNVDISNAWQDTEAARGSVSHVNFSVVRTRRVLTDVKDARGLPLPQGASVFDAAGNFVTVVGSNGSVFIPDAENTGPLEVQTSGRTLCSFRLSLPEKPAAAELYETAKAICR